MDTALIAFVALSFSGVIDLEAMATVNRISVWALFNIAIGGFVLAKPKRLRAARPLLWMTAWLLLYFVVGYLLADASPEATGAVVGALLVYVPVFAVVGLALHDRSQWERLAVALQVVALGACAVSVAQTVSPAVLDYTTLSAAAYKVSGDEFSLNRIPALWMNPNQAALCFVFMYAVSFWCRIPWLAWVGRLASIVGTLLSVSRGGMLAMAAFTAAYLLATSLMSLRQGRMKVSVVARRFGSVAGIAIAIWCLGVVMPVQRDELFASVTERARAGDRLTDGNVQSMADLRYSLATYWLDKAISGPWYGGGLLSFQSGDGFVNLGPHNQFIKVYGEVGIVGFLTYLLVLGIGIHRTWVIPMIQRDRLILLLTWGVFLFWHFEAHGLLYTRECMVIWGVLFTAPYVLSSARPRTAGLARFRAGMCSGLH